MTPAAARDHARSRGRARLDRKAAFALVVLFVAVFAVSRGCQQSQVRITQQQAIAAAQRQVDFTPKQTQIRLVRQGLNARPYWAVSLSVPTGDGGYSRLATVRIDANTGKVAAVTQATRPG